MMTDDVRDLLVTAQAAVWRRQWGLLGRIAAAIAGQLPPEHEILARQVAVLIEDEEPELALVLWDEVVLFLRRIDPEAHMKKSKPDTEVKSYERRGETAIERDGKEAGRFDIQEPHHRQSGGSTARDKTSINPDRERKG